MMNRRYILPFSLIALPVPAEAVPLNSLIPSFPSLTIAGAQGLSNGALTGNPGLTAYTSENMNITGTSGHATNVEFGEIKQFTSGYGYGCTGNCSKVTSYRTMRALTGAGDSWVGNDLLSFESTNPISGWIGEWDLEMKSSLKYGAQAVGLASQLGGLNGTTPFTGKGIYGLNVTGYAYSGGTANAGVIVLGALGAPLWQNGFVTGLGTIQTGFMDASGASVAFRAAGTNTDALNTEAATLSGAAVALGYGQPITGQDNTGTRHVVAKMQNNTALAIGDAALTGVIVGSPLYANGGAIASALNLPNSYDVGTYITTANASDYSTAFNLACAAGVASGKSFEIVNPAGTFPVKHTLGCTIGSLGVHITGKGDLTNLVQDASMTSTPLMSFTGAGISIDNMQMTGWYDGLGPCPSPGASPAACTGTTNGSITRGASGLSIGSGSSNVTIRNLNVHNFNDHEIVLGATNVALIQGNRVGYSFMGGGIIVSQDAASDRIQILGNTVKNTQLGNIQGFFPVNHSIVANNIADGSAMGNGVKGTGTVADNFTFYDNGSTGDTTAAVDLTIHDNTGLNSGNNCMHVSPQYGSIHDNICIDPWQAGIATFRGPNAGSNDNFGVDVHNNQVIWTTNPTASDASRNGRAYIIRNYSAFAVHDNYSRNATYDVELNGIPYAATPTTPATIGVTNGYVKNERVDGDGTNMVSALFLRNVVNNVTISGWRVKGATAFVSTDTSYGTPSVRYDNDNWLNGGALATAGAAFNGSAPVAKPTLPANGSDAASTQALANALKAALVANGLAQ